MKKLVIHEDAKKEAVAALETVAEAVATTLGPKGLPFIIEKSNSIDAKPSPTVTKDGLTVLRSLSFAEPIQHAIHNLCIQSSSATVLEGGDGTTSTIVMASAVANAIQKAVHKNIQPQVYARKIKSETEKIIAELEKEVDKSPEAARVVAFTSSNQDEDLTDFVMQAIEKSSAFGSVLVEKNPASKIDYEISVREGLVAGRGYEEHRQYGNTLSQKVAENAPFEILNPKILMYDGDLISKNQVVPLIKHMWEISQTEKYVICAYEISQEVANVLAEVNLSNPDFKVWACSMRITGESNSRWHKMQDLGAYTGGTPINNGVVVQNSLNISHYGTCDKITVSPDKTIFTGKAENHYVPTRVLQNENAREHAPNEFEKEHIRQRNSELTNGLVKIVIGNGHIANLQERADRADDALKAAQACLRSGALPGCGVSYIRGAKLANVSQELKNACHVIHNKILSNYGTDFTYDFGKGETVRISDEKVDVGSFIDLKIADSFDTVKSVLRNGVELGTLVATMGGYSLTTDLDQLEQLERASRVLGQH